MTPRSRNDPVSEELSEIQRLSNEQNQHNAALAVINSVHEGLTSHLDMDSIFELVGERISKIFPKHAVALYTVDQTTGMAEARYMLERGFRHYPSPLRPGPIGQRLIETKKPLMIGSRLEFEAIDACIVEGAAASKSGVYAPMVVKERVIGSLAIENPDEEYAFSDSDLHLVASIASSLGLALENARLFDETQHLLEETEQRAAELQIINSVQEGLASKLDMQAIYDLVGDKIREIFNADTTFIAFHDGEHNIIIAPYYTDAGERNVLISRPYGQGLAEVIIESGDPLLLNTSEEMNEAGAFNVASPGSEKDLNESFLGVPIIRNGKAIGATSVQSYQQRAFDQNDLSLLQTLTNSMSVALENAHLFNETQHLLQETEQRAAELATINTVSQALVAESELDALIELIGEQMRQTFSADIVYVALLEPGSKIIRFPFTYGENLESLRLGEGLTSKIIENGEPLLINSQMDKRHAEMGVTQVGKQALSYLGVPIQMRGQTFGVISVQSTRQEGRFDQEDLRLLSTIAANVGTAIHNAQLFDAIKRQGEYYEAVIEYSPAAIILMDMHATITGWNPAAEKLFGYTEEEAIGQNIDDLVAKSKDLHAEAMRYSQKGFERKTIRFLARRTHKDGSLVDVEVSGVPINVDAEQEEFIAIYHDVSELQHARQAAEEANQAKSTFLANMSHELRTPLNAILGFTRIVRRNGQDVLPQKQIENLDKVVLSADHLLNLINTVLDISKIEAGKMEVKPVAFELPPMINQVVDTSQPLLEEGVTLLSDIQSDLPQLYSDQDKIRQILFNLLSNAAKFTHQGEIILSARYDGEMLDVNVSDTGIGVSDEALGRIFEDFQQADSSTTREYGGTGLGLPISRSLARLLGGDLTACSIEKEGTTFTLTIPLRYIEAPSTEVPESATQMKQLNGNLHQSREAISE